MSFAQMVFGPTSCPECGHDPADNDTLDAAADGIRSAIEGLHATRPTIGIIATLQLVLNTLEKVGGR